MKGGIHRKKYGKIRMRGKNKIDINFSYTGGKMDTKEERETK